MTNDDTERSTMPADPRPGTWRARLANGYLEDEHGCHIWQRAKNSRGYGVIWVDGSLRLAHRVSWLAATGSWPTDGLVVDHICEVKACINPHHLRLLDNGSNIMRATPRGDTATESRRAAWRKSQRAARARGAAS